MAIEGGPAILVPDHMTDRDVLEGRARCQQIRALVQEYQARGRKVSAVWVNTDTANKMRRFFQARADKFDGVLPQFVLGVPLHEGSTGGDDVRLLFDDASSANS